MPSARRIRWAKIRVMVMSAAALFILGVLLYLLTGGGIFRQRAGIRTYVPDSTGLEHGSPVRLNGISIGSVESVSLARRPTPSRAVEVRMSVFENYLTRIPVDSFAQINSDTMVGDRYVDISAGTSPRHIQPGGEIPFQAAPEMLKNIDLRQFRQRIKQVDNLITDIEQQRNPVGKFIMTDNLYRSVLGRVVELDHSLQNAVSTTTTLGKLLYTDSKYNDLRAPLLRLEQTLERMQAKPLLSSPAGYDNVQKRIVDIRKTVATVSQSEWVRGDRRYAAWNRTLGHLIVAVDDFNTGSGMLNADSYESLNGTLRDLTGGIREFRQNPKKYMRFKIF